MPTVRQITVNATSISSPRDKGNRIESNLRSCFPASPIYTGDMTDTSIKEYYQENVLDATNIAGNGFSNVSLNYGEAPDFESIDIADPNLGEKLPSPFMPNPVSPGPGNVQASKKAEFTGNVPDMESNVEFGSGLGGTVSPSTTSAEISAQGTVANNLLGSYILGKSYPGSDGTT